MIRTMNKPGGTETQLNNCDPMIRTPLHMLFWELVHALFPLRLCANAFGHRACDTAPSAL